MVHPRPFFGVVMVAVVLLSACSGEAERDVVAGDPLAGGVAGQEDQFGKGFGKAFRADPNSEPAKVSDADVHPVSRTAEPIDVD